MKKRRVLALLLALSLAVSMNGMTVLATGPDAVDFPVTAGVDDNTVKEEEQSADTQKGDDTHQPEASEEENRTDGQGNVETVGGETDSGTTDNAGGTGSEVTDGDEDVPNPGDSSEDQDNPDDQIQDGDAGKEEQPDQSSEGEDETEPGGDNSGKEDDPDNNAPEDAGDPEEGGPEEDSPEESVSDNAMEEETQIHSTAVKMMSFTDEVGMVVTYNAATPYEYTVDENGTLTAIKVRKGEQLEDVEGNVVLADDQGIKRIGQGAFTGNTKITYVSMPAGVTSIGENAFKGCTSLKGMTIPTGVTVIETSAFEGCSGLTQFALPATITSIGNRAFYGDARLFMVYMRNIDNSQLQSIGDYAFYGCNALSEFCSDMEFTFPDAMTTIGDYAFYDCDSVVTIEFSKNIISLGVHAFESCSNLKKVVLPDKLETVSEYGFAECISLMKVEFGNANQTNIIGSYSFKGCYSLHSIEFSKWVQKIETGAFEGCTGLLWVKIPQPKCLIKQYAFPPAATLTLIGWTSSGQPSNEDGSYYVDTFAQLNGNQFCDIEAKNDTQFYKYAIQKTGTGTGEIYVSLVSGGDWTKDPNKENGGTGVKAGTKLYVGLKPDSGSKTDYVVKCNGEVIKPVNNEMSFEMPAGGAVLSAEFELKDIKQEIDGISVSYELSNGSDLKVGQTTRLFLLDANNKIVPSSKIKFSTKPSTSTVASVTDQGVITALKEGSVVITAETTGGNNQKIQVEVLIEVKKPDAVSVKVNARDYNTSLIKVTEKMVGEQLVQTASLDQIVVRTAPATLTLRAQAYDKDGDAMKVALQWTTSDAKVAKLAKSSTANAESDNKITIPQGANGEATITVTATNADKKIKQKFIIQVKDYTPRLSASSITLNLEKEEEASLRIISSYDSPIDPGTFKLMSADNDKVESPYFDWEYDSTGSFDGSYRYIIRPKKEQIDKKVYNVKVKVNSYDPIPLNITVKSSIPAPKVSFDKKQKKINLFYANDGTEIRPVITNLGTEKIESYSLESLTDSKDDKLFTENFEIDEATGVITQKNENLVYTDKNKLITTGYLVLRFEGYKDKVVKKYKITIPTQTIKPSYKLDKTSDTFNLTADEQTVFLTLMDSKTKKQVVLDDADWTVELTDNTETNSVLRENVSIDGDGRIEMVVNSTPKKGRVRFSIRNNEWAIGQAFTYTYTIKTTSATPKVTLRTATVNMNSQYPEQTGEFALKSNQCDTVLADEQEFAAVSSARNAAEYEKLKVEYTSGVGTVSIEDESIKNGTYKFKAAVIKTDQDENLNGVTLTVKVTNAVPTMKLKGSASLNLAARTDDDYTETAEVALNAKLPEGYSVEEIATVDSIVCTSKNVDVGFEEKFDWEIADNVLRIALNSPVTAKTYAFSMTPVYIGDNGSTVTGKAVKFNVKVYKGEISVKLSAKGTLNLLDRGNEYTVKNSIVYTPTFTNLKDTVEEALIFDGSRAELGDEESAYFIAEVVKGKIYVTPKEGAEIENKKTYPVRIWLKLANYGGYEGMWVPGQLNIKTAQTLPKVTTDKSTIDLYLSKKTYEAVFTVTPKAGSVGKAVDAVFGEKDTKSEESFNVICEPQDDGSMEVRVSLKDTVSYPGNTTSKVTMYVMFEGQGVKTTGTAITMNFRINK